MNKNGSSFDNIYIAVSFFAFALFLLAALVFWNGLTSTAMNEQFWEKTDVGISSRNAAAGVYDNLDNMGIIAYFALHLGILVTAFGLRSHPFVYVAGIFIIIITIMIAAPLSNAYETAANSNSDLLLAQASLPKVSFIMSIFPMLEMIWGFITAIVLYGLAKSEDFI